MKTQQHAISRRISRRTMLRGALGVGVALPWMEIMLPRGLRAQSAATPPKRFGVFFSPCGTIPENWRSTALNPSVPTPSSTSPAISTQFTLSPILQPLAPFQQDIVVLRGVSMETTRPTSATGPGRIDVLVVNAGSTSLKLDLVDEREASQPLESFDAVDPAAVAAVAHRVVHGGERFRAPALVDDAVLAGIAELRSLAPLHNTPALRELEAARKRFPGLPHVAVFDTAFHATIPPAAATYAVPRRWREEWGVRRYGFHGLSVAWACERAPAVVGRPPQGLRLVVCHLGGGSSVTAVADGRSLDTTMGLVSLVRKSDLTLSGKSGVIPLTVENRFSYPVKVAIRITTDHAGLSLQFVPRTRRLAEMVLLKQVAPVIE